MINEFVKFIRRNEGNDLSEYVLSSVHWGFCPNLHGIISNPLNLIYSQIQFQQDFQRTFKINVRTVVALFMY